LVQIIDNAFRIISNLHSIEKEKQVSGIIQQLILEETSYGYWEWEENQPFNSLSPTLI